MNLDESRLFRALEPPTGGADRFRRRLDAQGKPRFARRTRLAIAGLAVSVLALFVLIAVTRHGEEPEPRVASLFDAPEFDRLLGRPMDRARFSISINGESPAVSEVPSTHETVRIYVVEIAGKTNGQDR